MVIFAPPPQELVDWVCRRGRWAKEVQNPPAAPVSVRAQAARGAGRDGAIRAYAAAALKRQTANVERAGKGTRNRALNDAALSLGHLVGAGALAENDVRAALEAAAAACGLTAADGIGAVRATISSGLRAGMAEPSDLTKIGTRARSQPAARLIDTAKAPLVPAGPPAAEGADSPPSRTGGKGRKPPRGDGGADDMNRRLAFRPLTDLGNAERFVERYRAVVKWVPNFGFYIWDGKRWSRTGADEYIGRAETETVRAIQDEASAIEGTASDKVITPPKGETEEPEMLSDLLRAWGRKSESAAKISAISKIARHFMAVEHAKFDADIFKINCNTCTLIVRRPRDVKDGDPLIITKPHDPADLITKLAPVDYAPDAGCPQFDKFLARVQPSDEMRRFLLQWLGYSLTGDAEEQKLAVFCGTGRNGKGTLMETVAAIAGDYAESVPVETFLANPVQRGGGQATPDLAKLPGVRMLRCAEPDKGAKLGEALIKRVTGGDPIDARHLNKEFFTFFAQFKLTISCNYEPRCPGNSEGIWGRLKLVPWKVFIPPEERDPELKAKLRKESSGILNRLLDGLRDWIEKGLVEPDEVKKATAEYRESSDPVGRFLKDCTESAAGKRVQAKELYKTYIAWAQYNAGPNYTMMGFGGILRDRGLQNIKNSHMYWIDLNLTKTEADFPGDGKDNGEDDGGISM